jgi:hypothetical protein
MTLPAGRPPRFLQLNTFYPAYLADFYAARPALADAPYRTHIDALLDDGFSGPHMMTREMAKRGWETMQIVANAAPAARAWLGENALSFSEPLNGALVAAMQIEMFRPDAIYIVDACTFDSRFLHNVPTKPPLVVGWRGFPIEPATDWRNFDLILTSFDAIAAEAPKFGARDVKRHYPGFPEAAALEPVDKVYDCDVIFCGSVTRHHRTRITLLEAIFRASRGFDGGKEFDFRLHMPDASALPFDVQAINRASLWGHTMLRAFGRARIVINIDVDAFSAQPPNMRLIEATGAGAFLLTPHHPELDRFFTPGAEIETFRDQAELIAKIRHYLADDASRRTIAARGQERCLRAHRLDQTAAHFHDMLVEKLAGTDKKQA